MSLSVAPMLWWRVRCIRCNFWFFDWHASWNRIDERAAGPTIPRKDTLARWSLGSNRANMVLASLYCTAAVLSMHVYKIVVAHYAQAHAQTPFTSEHTPRAQMSLWVPIFIGFLYCRRWLLGEKDQFRPTRPSVPWRQYVQHHLVEDICRSTGWATRIFTLVYLALGLHITFLSKKENRVQDRSRGHVPHLYSAHSRGISLSSYFGDLMPILLMTILWETANLIMTSFLYQVCFFFSS